MLVSFFFELRRSVNTLCLFGMSDSLRFKGAVVFEYIVPLLHLASVAFRCSTSCTG